MLEAVVCLFAVYGVCCFLYFNLEPKWKQGPFRAVGESPENQIWLVVKVRDAENTIEALVWQYVKFSRDLEYPHKLVIIDTGSQDQTVEIIKRLTNRYPYLTLACENDQFGTRQIVVEYTQTIKPEQIVDSLARTFRQEFST